MIQGSEVHVSEYFPALPTGWKVGPNERLSWKKEPLGMVSRPPGDASRISPLLNPAGSLGDVSFLAQLQTWSAAPVTLC